MLERARPGIGHDPPDQPQTMLVYFRQKFYLCCPFNRFLYMVKFNRFTLDNGLRVIVHEDHTTPMAVLNILYDVGARDEDPGQTGFAHLFEHLMFGGSVTSRNTMSHCSA